MTNKSTVEAVAIIGAGIGGLYLVAQLSIAGFKLQLHDIDNSKLSEIQARGGVEVEGEKGRFAAVERTTTDLASMVDGADVIIIVSGGNTQTAVARSLAPLLRDDQVVLLIQGNTAGSLIVRRALDNSGCQAEVDVAEMDNYPYSCSRLSPTPIRPIVKKRWLQIATFPATALEQYFRACHFCFRKESRRRISSTGLYQRECDPARGELRRRAAGSRAGAATNSMRRA